jgi:hypothetical protein
MSRTRFAFSIAVVALLVASPATGQLVNFPVLALSPADGVTSIGGGWGRGLNADSGELNAFGVGVRRSMEKVSFSIAGGYVLDARGADDGKTTFSGALAYHLPLESSVNLSIQTGIGYISLAETELNFPVGLAITGSTEAGSMMVTPWIMPRVHFTRVGGTNSATATDFGASGGIGFATEGGFGFGVAADLLLVDDGAGGSNSAFRISVGVNYALGN